MPIQNQTRYLDSRVLDGRTSEIRHYDAPSAPATDIVSFPRSVQARLDEAQTLLRQERPQAAISALELAATELARSSPELLILAIASQTGARRLTVEDTRMDTRTVRTEKKILGLTVREEVTVTTDAHTRRRTLYFD